MCIVPEHHRRLPYLCKQFLLPDLREQLLWVDPKQSMWAMWLYDGGLPLLRQHDVLHPVCWQHLLPHIYERCLPEVLLCPPQLWDLHFLITMHILCQQWVLHWFGKCLQSLLRCQSRVYQLLYLWEFYLLLLHSYIFYWSWDFPLSQL